MSDNEYSQGICGDGAAILKNGQPMTIEEIVQELKDWQAARAHESINRGHSRSWLNTLDRWIDLMSRVQKEPVCQAINQEVQRVKTEVMRYREHRVAPNIVQGDAEPESIEVAIYMLEDYASALENGDLDGAGHSTTSCIYEVIAQLAAAPQPPQEGGQ